MGWSRVAEGSLLPRARPNDSLGGLGSGSGESKHHPADEHAGHPRRAHADSHHAYRAPASARLRPSVHGVIDVEVRSLIASRVMKLRIGTPLNTGSQSSRAAVATVTNWAVWSHGSL